MTILPFSTSERRFAGEDGPISPTTSFAASVHRLRRLPTTSIFVADTLIHWRVATNVE
jgi:hypothetical protein